MAMKPQFITVEGVEGVGKSTNVTFIHQYLLDQGIDVVVTREPGGTPLAENIRDLLLASNEESLTDISELLLMFAARSQHIERVIKPALERGQWVLCDRFTDATFAYQGGGRGMNRDLITSLAAMVQKELSPDLTFLLDCDVAIGMQRVVQRGKRDRFELEKMDFFQRVRAEYVLLADQHRNRFVTINAQQPLLQVKASLLDALQKKIQC